MHSPIRLITIGRLGPTKGHEYALEAVRDLVESGYSIEYRIVGDGALLQTLAEHVDELGLGAVVKFDGSVSSDSIVRLLCDADILVAPSIVAPTGQTEGVPNVLKEAMASGVPAIGTMVGGANELIDHGRNGYLVPQKDPKAIADCVRTIIAHQEDMPKILSRARQSIEQDYNLKQLNGDLEDAYIRAGSVH
jgi:colanic acid/amylovoran biosynthesis glycosyltransferase